MSQQLLLAACEQAERSETAVRAAALMHIARVMACSDQTAAEQLLEQGIELAEKIGGDPPSPLLRNAVSLSAAVSAKHGLPLYARYRQVDPFGGSVVGLVNVMAQHGHIKDAIAYLRHPFPGDRFPLDFVGNLERDCHDDESRRQLLELAIQEWRNPAPRERPGHDFAPLAFAGLFARYWKLLPPEAAAPVLRELAGWALVMKPEPGDYTLTENPDDPKLTSLQENELFALMPAIQHFEPDRARSVLEAHPRVAAAMKRFPLGMRSVREEPNRWRYDPARDDVVVIGDSQVMPIAEALATDFEAPFRHALESSANDTDAEFPNSACKENWPSTAEFRHILFKAGTHQGAAGAKHLDRIPDRDLRLFAQIELCAGIAGLPELGGLTTQYSRKPQILSPAELEQIFGSVLDGIRCPQCKWEPRTNSLWTCKCGHSWNTFDTRGLCPNCGYQWQITACFQCGAESPHLEWYVEN